MLCFRPETRIPYESMIIIEPPMNDRQLRDEHLEDRTRHMALLAKAVGSQRTEFESREAAYEWMRKKSPWKIWDDRVLRIFVVSTCFHRLRTIFLGSHHNDYSILT